MARFGKPVALEISHKPLVSLAKGEVASGTAAFLFFNRLARSHPS
jgi:hypothetical protein